MPSSRRSYGDARRVWSDPFVEYMATIVDHPNYAGMPCTRDAQGKIDWTIPSNRKLGSKNWDGNTRRRDWWRQKAAEVGIATEGEWISRVARAIHPFGAKPCQTCGRVMKLQYVYPTARTLAALNRDLPEDAHLLHADLLPIEEVVLHVCSVLGEPRGVEVLRREFPDIGPPPKTHLEVAAAIRQAYCLRLSRKFSPGAMSNAPDRLDGFHTYNLCCRGLQDRGRTRDNLVTYTVDRRAYEHWCEGDWAVADRVMSGAADSGICVNCGETRPVTADHIGPISLGFAHSPHFRPLCGPCNSAKNNRMTHQDVADLIRLEEAGGVVISWHGAELWNAIKYKVGSDQDALLASKLLRINQHHYLTTLGVALAAGVPDVLLQFLHPEHAGFRIELDDFDPQTLELRRIRRVPRQDGYAQSRASRMVRVAFESLLDYSARPKRNIQVVDPALVTAQRSAFETALVDAASQPTHELRASLLELLELRLPADEMDERLSSLLPLGSALHRVEPVRQALAGLMRGYAVVLADRFDRGEAVGWGDFVDVS